MSVLLIQVNGAEQDEVAPPGHHAAGGRGPRYCDDPLVHHQYVNGGDHWRQEGFGRRDAWETASPGDAVLLYSTGTVHDEWGASLSHVLRIEEKQIDDVGARMVFDEVIELDPKIDYQEIHDRVGAGEFSTNMRYCGQEGFNITRVEERDLETVSEYADVPLDPVYQVA